MWAADPQWFQTETLGLLIPVAFIAPMVMAVVIAAYFQRRENRRTATEWPRAAAQLGLSWTGGKLPRMEGSLRGWHLVIETVESEESSSTYACLVLEGAKIDQDILICSESAWTRFKKLLGDGDVQLRNATFDERVHLRGPESRIFALMNHATRKAVLRLLKYDSSVHDGKITVAMGDGAWQCEEIVTLVEIVGEAAAQLEIPPEATARALAENALLDPLSEIRHRNQECLSALLCSPSSHTFYDNLNGAHPLSEETARAAHAALSDPDPRVRLLGALLVDAKERFAVLDALVREDTADADTKARAQMALTPQFLGAR